jgi:hypothetical protein
MMGVPLDKVVVLLGGSSFPVSAGSHGQWGANNSTAGVYPACVKLREAIAQKLGQPNFHRWLSNYRGVMEIRHFKAWMLAGTRQKESTIRLGSEKWKASCFRPGPIGMRDSQHRLKSVTMMDGPIETFGL